jgi:hypothetical protein
MSHATAERKSDHEGEEEEDEDEEEDKEEEDDVHEDDVHVHNAKVSASGGIFSKDIGGHHGSGRESHKVIHETTMSLLSTEMDNAAAAAAPNDGDEDDDEDDDEDAVSVVSSFESFFHAIQSLPPFVQVMSALQCCLLYSIYADGILFWPPFLIFNALVVIQVLDDA